MYIGAGMTLAGAALYHESLSIFIYACVFFLITHLFVVCVVRGADFATNFQR
jgi:hypothetical protein